MVMRESVRANNGDRNSLDGVIFDREFRIWKVEGAARMG
jgi:hypothetical protein